ncbi:hypothetical protein D3C73_1174770 [compost metagenome]
MELELAAAGVVDRYAEYVGRQQVGGELHALEAQPQAAGQGMGQCGLAETGQVFDQQMAAREQGHEGQSNLLHLAQHQRIDLVLRIAQGLTQLIG